MIKPYLEAGEFVTTHGIAGEIKLYPWSDDAKFMTQFKNLYLSGAGGKALKVIQARVHKNMCIVKLEGYDSIEQVRVLIGKTVYIARAEAGLPEGRYFVQDLLGAKVCDGNTGQVYGAIQNITHPGRQDIYEICSETGETYYFPAVEPFLGEVNLEKETVLVYPIPGMFEPEEENEKPARKKKSKRHHQLGEGQGE